MQAQCNMATRARAGPTVSLARGTAKNSEGNTSLTKEPLLPTGFSTRAGRTKPPLVR